MFCSNKVMPHSTCFFLRQHNNFNCSCSAEQNCHDSYDRGNRCHCDATPAVLTWLNDTIVITNQELLPITGFRYGFLRGMANFTIGNLICQGINGNFTLENRLDNLDKEVDYLKKCKADIYNRYSRNNECNWEEYLKQN